MLVTMIGVLVVVASSTLDYHWYRPIPHKVEHYVDVAENWVESPWDG
jgi:hypothetical protein